MMDWNDIWRAIRLARKYADSDTQFLEILESHGVTVAPLRLRRDCDLWGISGLVKTGPGYDVIEPNKLTVQP